MFKQFSCNTIMKTKYHRPINLLLLTITRFPNFKDCSDVRSADPQILF